MHVPHALRILSAGALLVADRHPGGRRRTRCTERPSGRSAGVDPRRCARSSTTIASSPGSTSAAAKLHRTPTSYSYRRSSDRAYLRWTIDRWTRRRLRGARPDADPDPPPPRGQPARGARPARLAAPPAHLQPRPDAEAAQDLPGHRHALVRERPGLERPGDAAPLAGAERGRGPRRRGARSAAAATQGCRAGCGRRSSASTSYEGAWTSNTGNGYYGGLQMDWRLHAHLRPRVRAAAGARPTTGPSGRSSRRRRGRMTSGRGFTPWPNTARACGLL